MGLNPLSSRSVERENRRAGTEWLHASADNSGRLLLAVGPDLCCYWVDRRGEYDVEKTDTLTSTTADARRIVWALLGGRAA